MKDFYLYEEEEELEAGPCEVAPYCPMNCLGCPLSERWMNRREEACSKDEGGLEAPLGRMRREKL